jgi:hypothetical protein
VSYPCTGCNHSTPWQQFFRQESLYACDYSPSHVDFGQWEKAVEGAKWKEIEIAHCVYSNAYTERD